VDQDLSRLIVRHRHVAPMLSALLTGMNAGVRITDASGAVVLEREAGGIGFEHFPILVEGETVGTVEGDRMGRAIAAVLSYALSRESDKRALAREALDRYRELTLVYDLADRLGGALSVEEIAAIAIEQAGRLPAGGEGFLLLAADDGQLRAVGGEAPAPVTEAHPGEGIVGAVAVSATAEEVNDVAADSRTTVGESALASIIVAPLVARGVTVGVLGAGSATRVDYQGADLKLIAAIAAIVGPAIAGAEAVAGRERAGEAAAAPPVAR
jgi:putative methionine-R-sulfoxide reductase with GAF domain